ncbi:SDR family oxidoreductase [Furfurilactobacillus siliginis]|uniref:NAD-dependent dehydratase n=1 Tax=Furfurilactobacillus siliginis TaxID=348151 RepID=A0A0R2L295_9LACO|nr:SDR family oxidoreductase [Furfurilactobacillus siliginis]KRN95774.1 hypothetical protein IV55_GL001879 [Furfurilactobacillus siliginis]GEK28950.1 NAD-dependent dehydratase [Furfurilactobacillus siliginis]
MANILILGANGSIATVVEQALVADNTQHHLTLFLRHPEKLTATIPNSTVIQGDVTDSAALNNAMKNQDIVYANLLGTDSIDQANTVIQAMQKNNVQRLIWVSVLGIYDEVPGAFGQWNKDMILDDYITPYALAAKSIEASELDYTLIRPAWYSNTHEIDYELTQKGTPFKGTEVSRDSVANFITTLINTPQQHIRESVGINRPNTDGAKPAWF